MYNETNKVIRVVLIANQSMRPPIIEMECVILIDTCINIKQVMAITVFLYLMET